MSKALLHDSIERALRTALQAGAAAVLAVWLEAGSFADIDWTVVWQVLVFATGASLLMAIVGSRTGNPDSGSVLNPEADSSP